MKLTLYTDYSLRVLMYLGIHGVRSVTIGEIARRHGISANHVMKVVHELGKLGNHKTIRGKKGGIGLGRLPAKVNVGRLVRLVECGGGKGGGVSCRNRGSPDTESK